MPTYHDVFVYGKALGMQDQDIKDFYEYRESTEWLIAGQPIRNWQAVMSKWWRKRVSYRSEMEGVPGLPPPIREDVRSYVRSRGYANQHADEFYDFYMGMTPPWTVLKMGGPNREPIRAWKRLFDSWAKKRYGEPVRVGLEQKEVSQEAEWLDSVAISDHAGVLRYEYSTDIDRTIETEVAAIRAVGGRPLVLEGIRTAKTAVATMDWIIVLREKEMRIPASDALWLAYQVQRRDMTIIAAEFPIETLFQRLVACHDAQIHQARHYLSVAVARSSRDANMRGSKE